MWTEVYPNEIPKVDEGYRPSDGDDEMRYSEGGQSRRSTVKNDTQSKGSGLVYSPPSLSPIPSQGNRFGSIDITTGGSDNVRDNNKKLSSRSPGEIVSLSSFAIPGRRSDS